MGQLVEMSVGRSLYPSGSRQSDFAHYCTRSPYPLRGGDLKAGTRTPSRSRRTSDHPGSRGYVRYHPWSQTWSRQSDRKSGSSTKLYARCVPQPQQLCEQRTQPLQTLTPSRRKPVSKRWLRAVRHCCVFFTPSPKRRWRTATSSSFAEQSANRRKERHLSSCIGCGGRKA